MTASSSTGNGSSPTSRSWGRNDAPANPRVVQRLALGPTWKTGKPEDQSGWDDHARFIDDLIDRGVFFMGGTWMEPARVDVDLGRDERRGAVRVSGATGERTKNARTSRGLRLRDRRSYAVDSPAIPLAMRLRGPSGAHRASAVPSGLAAWPVTPEVAGSMPAKTFPHFQLQARNRWHRSTRFTAVLRA
jgi:hypothetical protein